MSAGSDGIDTDTIKRFVRGTLGCACPDAVFEHIDCRRETGDAGTTVVRLLIGARLLVRVITPVDAAQLEAHLARWVARGIAEREAAGLNRFRLVLGCDNPASLSARAHAIFDGLESRDDRVHLHLLGSMALADLPTQAR